MKKTSQVTLEDVAKLAQVSRATVSRVINAPDKVSADIVARTNQAIRDLRYAPNRHARALSLGKLRTVGLVFFEDIRTLFSNPFWGEVLNPVYENLALHNLSCNLIACGTFSSEPHEEVQALYENFVTQGSADGYIFFGQYPEEIERRFGMAHLPIVIFGKPYFNNSEFSYVDTDNISGAAEAVRFLVSTGRKRIATITGPVESGAGFDRFLGYKNGLIESRVKFDPKLVVHGDWTKESAMRGMKSLLSNERKIDAVFVASDLMAAGAMEVILDANLKIPKDVAIIGFDNSSLCELTRPKLTSVGQPFVEIGKELVTAVIKSIDGVSHQSRILGAEIIERESS